TVKAAAAEPALYQPLGAGLWLATTLGAAGAGVQAEVTLTVKVAGAVSKLPPVLLPVWVRVIVEVPAVPGVTWIVRESPQLVNVRLDGETVAVAGFDDATEKPAVVEPVRLQPCLPSPFAWLTRKVTVVALAPTLRLRVSAVASIVASK